MSQHRHDYQLILQRVRNRMIDYLTLAADFRLQREYQRRTPQVNVANEVINQWEDCFNHDSAWLTPPVFTEAEKAAVERFDRVWQRVADSTPGPLPELGMTHELPAWEELRVAAAETLKSFVERGKLDDASWE